jgi:tripartite-type tricarboxylate transporter receptor subunit TctC
MKSIKVLLISLFSVCCASSMAQTYPTKAVRVIVPFAAGGGIDMVARVISQRLQEVMGQPFVVENKPGAGGVVGSEIVATARPDGYTLLAVPISHAANVSLTKMSFNPVTAFSPIIHIASAPNVVLVHPSLPANSIGEFIAYARKNPGSVTYASSGNGSSTHLAAEQFKMLANVELLHVPYKGGGPALVDLLGGHVSMYIGSLPAAIPHLRGQKLKGLGITSSKRAIELPELPTVIEGGIAGYEYVGWYGLLATAGTPPAVIDRLNAEVNKILKEPAILEKLAGDGAQPIGGTPAQFDAHIKKEISKWASVIKHAKIEGQ